MTRHRIWVSWKDLEGEILAETSPSREIGLFAGKNLGYEVAENFPKEFG